MKRARVLAAQLLLAAAVISGAATVFDAVMDASPPSAVSADGTTPEPSPSPSPGTRDNIDWP